MGLQSGDLSYSLSITKSTVKLVKRLSLRSIKCVVLLRPSPDQAVPPNWMEDWMEVRRGNRSERLPRGL